MHIKAEPNISDGTAGVGLTGEWREKDFRTSEWRGRYCAWTRVCKKMVRDSLWHEPNIRRGFNSTQQWNREENMRTGSVWWWVLGQRSLLVCRWSSVSWLPATHDAITSMSYYKEISAMLAVWLHRSTRQRYIENNKEEFVLRGWIPIRPITLTSLVGQRNTVIVILRPCCVTDNDKIAPEYYKYTLSKNGLITVNL